MAKKAFLTLVDAADAPDGGLHHESRTLIERAYLHLRDDIIEGQLAPGEKLRVEHLKSHYGVGAGTLREAITRLVSDALVVAEGQRGFRVAPIAIDDLMQLTDLRVHVELEALRQSIRRADERWRLELRSIYEQLSEFENPINAECRKPWERLNARFHEALISGCGNRWTLKILRLLSRQTERYRHLAIRLPNSGRDVHEEHRQIFVAAMGGQEARAALALETHIRATPELLAGALRDASMPAGNGTTRDGAMLLAGEFAWGRPPASPSD